MIERALSGSWKLIEYVAGGSRRSQLFELGSDPYEMNNLAGDPSHAGVLRELYPER